ncbi:hypothetical protein BCR39DRAFT_588023 [Naematelia encephala]|uniref:Uncharacterized protein n=1 Tax=Naematelia encephala TaxID=71784 RepID=A0A1Y2B6Z1_9TREE|nr:hypothetical protein BCR39DRAFT_588023 [Naematelia encephala]
MGFMPLKTIRSILPFRKNTKYDSDPVTALSVRTKSKAYKSDSKTEAWTALVNVFRGEAGGNRRYSRYSWARTDPGSLASLLDRRNTQKATTAAQSLRTYLKEDGRHHLAAAVRSFMSFSNVDDDTIQTIEQSLQTQAQEQTNTVPVVTSAFGA